MNISSLLKRNQSQKIAIKQGESSITYLEWNQKSSELADLIETLLASDSVTVGIFLPNSINYAISYFAILFSNRTIVPIDIRAKSPEILSTINYCETDLLITNSNNYELLKTCIEQHEYRVNLYNIDTGEIIVVNEEKKLIFKSKSLTINNDENDVAIMLHTSGTTSHPKRVMLSHKNIICNIESNIESLHLTVDERCLVALPMCFGYCNTAQFLTHVYLGATLIILDSVFLPKQFFEIVEREKVTNFTGVPTMLIMLLEYKFASKYNISSLKYICFGGGFMPIDKLKSLIDKYPSIGFIQTYGQTECSPRITALLPEDSKRKIGSVGKAIPGVDIKIVDKNGKAIQSGKIGEIIVRGDNVMKGYYKREEYTNKVICNNWLHTGDIGFLDTEGYLYLTGRIKNIIISGGINIYPEEIEQCLLQHPKIKDIRIVGEKHNVLGEVPIAQVVVRSKTTERELKTYCLEHLSQHKVPKRFEFVLQIPKTYNGKLKRIPRSCS